MRILWLKSDYVVPPDTGGKIRSYNLLCALNRLADVDYVSFRPCATPEQLPEEKRFAKRIVTFYRAEENKRGIGFACRVLAGMRSRLPYTVQKYRSSRIREAQRAWHDQSDVSSDGSPALVLCDFLEMGENVNWEVPCPKVLFQHNVESVIWQRYYENETHPAKKAYFRFESARMRRYESAICNRFDLVLTVSENDKRVLLESLGVRAPIEVIDTGVDTAYFSALPDIEITRKQILFLGSLDWMPNIHGLLWFTSQVYPLIKHAIPEATLRVVGRRPVPEVLRLQALDPSIRIVADVPDVRPHVATCELFVVPLHIGGGTRIKIYEAMAMARSVVSTSIGAEGLPMRANEHLLLADITADFAHSVGDC